jgi:hypothetical protein
VDQSDQYDRGGGGLYGGLDQVKLQGTGIFIQNSNHNLSVKERVEGFERMLPKPIPFIKDGQGGSGFGFTKNPEGANPFLRLDSPLKRRKLSLAEAPSTCTARSPSSPRRSLSRRRPLMQCTSTGQLSTPTRRTSQLMSTEGTRGRALPSCLPIRSSVIILQPSTSNGEATSSLPPEIRPQLLPFWTSNLGASSSSSSSRKRKLKLETKRTTSLTSTKEKYNLEENSAVRNLVKKIESSEETEDIRKELPEEERRIVLGRKKKEDQEDQEELSQKVRGAYLQGVRPETRRGLLPASPDHPESGDDTRGSILSSAGGSTGEAEQTGYRS